MSANAEPSMIDDSPLSARREQPAEPQRPLLPVVLTWALRIGLAGLFAFAGIMKLKDPSAFAIEIHNYQVWPSTAPVVAATLPFIEVVLAAALLFGRGLWLRAGALAGAVVLGVFTVAVASVVYRGINVDCGCFGSGSGPITMLTVARDVALVAAAVVLYRLAPRPAQTA